MKKVGFVLIAVIGMLFVCPAKSISSEFRTIVKVEAIEVNSPVGTVPRLPYSVWVTYSDGQSEYRQTRWTNAALATEEAQADSSVYKAGSEYTINGYIIGDDTTVNGYPIVAQIKVVDGMYKTPTAIPAAEPIPLNQVTITGDNRLTSNRDLAIQEIISWDVSQQLYNYRDTYGLSTEGYVKADGWDSPTTKLKGHGSGHYMSALAFAFASATKAEQKEILRNNIKRMVDELRECQERTFVWNDKLGRYWEARDFAPETELLTMKGSWKDFDVYKTQWKSYGYGYLNAIPAHHPALIEKYSAYNNSDWVWAPYYSIHKQLAGLIDIATYVDEPQIAEKALLIAKDMGLWIWNRLHYRTYVETGGTQEERRAKPGNRYEMWNIYIAGEDGGTGESLARLSELVSKPEEKQRLLEASNYFDSPAFYDPLAKNIDDIRTRHANQHIPKITSALWSYRGNKNPYYFNLAENFWNLIQGRYRYATGGVGNGEMFRQPYTQVLSMATNVTSDHQRNLHPAPNINETCCAYNLAKLTKDLNTFNPDDARYMDYYERVLYNQLIGSLNPAVYQTTYQYAVGLNASKPWGNNTPQSTCCGGTGSENHVKYQEAAYFTSDNTLWVALYLPTTLSWKAKNVTLEQSCLWPAEKSTIRLTKNSANFTLKLRVPYWATSGFDVKLNGKSIASSYQPSSYVTIPARDWTPSDVVEVIMPFGKHIDFGPDKLETAATAKNVTNTSFTPMWVGTLMYGPLAMTAGGVNNWDEAILDVSSSLDNIITNQPRGNSTGVEGNLYTLTLGDKQFQPDYYRHRNTTHYFRINLIGDPNQEIKQELWDKLQETATFNASNYTKKSFASLRKTREEGERIYQLADVSENQINQQIALLTKAVDQLATSKLDKKTLSKMIKDGEAKIVKNYTWDTFEALQQELKKARIVETQSKKQTDVDLQSYALSQVLEQLVPVGNVDRYSLKELLHVVEKRIAAQEAWHKLVVKVPEYSPWAPYGFARLKEQSVLAQQVFDNKNKNYNQTEVNEAASALNAAINTMRPGNLPELEDLGDLLSLLTQAKGADKRTKELNEAIEYSEMVVKYVGDGSGTHDMIENALKRLKEVIEK